MDGFLSAVGHAQGPGSEGKDVLFGRRLRPVKGSAHGTNGFILPGVLEHPCTCRLLVYRCADGPRAGWLRA